MEVTKAFIQQKISYLRDLHKSDNVTKKQFKQEKEEFLSIWDSLNAK